MEDKTTAELGMPEPGETAAAEAPAKRKQPAKPVKRVTGRDAIAKVLADGQPRPAKEITAAAVKLVRPAMTGKTPEATLGALLYTQAKRADGLVTKTGSGRATTFTLRPKESK